MIVSSVFVPNEMSHFRKQPFVVYVFCSDDLSVLKNHNVIISWSDMMDILYIHHASLQLTNHSRYVLKISSSK